MTASVTVEFRRSGRLRVAIVPPLVSVGGRNSAIHDRIIGKGLRLIGQTFLSYRTTYRTNLDRSDNQDDVTANEKRTCENRKSFKSGG